MAKDHMVDAALGNSSSMVQAIVRLLLSEINTLRQAAGLQPRTLAQVRNAILNEMKDAPDQ